MDESIFSNRPFEFNIKCVIISIIGIILFLLPGIELCKYNLMFWITLVILFIFLYVGIAYYDKLYDCDFKMKSGKYSITTAFKPKDIDDLKKERKYLKSVHLMHVFFVSSVLIYSCYLGSKCNKLWFGKILPFVTVGTMGYHGIRYFKPRI